jgi:hypothetical protein
MTERADETTAVAAVGGKVGNWIRADSLEWDQQFQQLERELAAVPWPDHEDLRRVRDEGYEEDGEADPMTKGLSWLSLRLAPLLPVTRVERRCNIESSRLALARAMGGVVHVPDPVQATVHHAETRLGRNQSSLDKKVEMQDEEEEGNAKKTFAVDVL